MAVQRRLPRWSEVRPLVRVEAPRVTSAQRLAAAATIEDLRLIARRRTPRAVFDYVDGAAESEISLNRARAAFDSVQFHPRVLRNVENVDPSTTLLGRPSALPVVLAPTGFTRMMHHQGEWAVSQAAAEAGIPYTLSTMGTAPLEGIAAVQPTGERWFQLYVWRDRARSLDLIQRAEAAGYSALVLTVDTAVAGQRLRDVRNGLTIPPALTPKTLADMATHPSWWANVLTTDPLEFASLRDSGGTVADLVDRMFDPGVTFADVAWLRENWDGDLIVKGIQHVDDAQALVELGVEGIVVSNHGGRQLDRAVAPLQVLPQMVDAVAGRAAVVMDTGVLRGSDVVAAVAAGADAVMVGRAYLYGLMAGGLPGVRRALAILDSQVRRTLALLGAASLSELTPDMVTIPDAPDGLVGAPSLSRTHGAAADPASAGERPDPTHHLSQHR